MSDLPWTCPDHPDAQIRHEWDKTTRTALLTGASISWKEAGSDQYFCNVCGRELAAEKPNV